MRSRYICLSVALALAALTLMAVTVPTAGAAPPCKARNLVTGSHYMGADALANAISAATAGDTVAVWGICGGSFLAIDKDLTLQGKGSKATLAFTNNVSVYGDVSVVLNDLTVTGGRQFGGGGLYVDFGTITLNNSTVTGNSAAVGGGIYSFAGTVVLNESAVINNIATDGGGIFVGFGTLTLNNSVVSGNRATDFMGAEGPNIGGGIYVFDGIVTLNDSTVSGNTSDGQAGGVYLGGAGQVLLNGTSTVTGNTPDNCFPTGSVPGCIN
jgi:hypothetical protein